MMSRTYIIFETRFVTNVFSGESFGKSTIFAHLLIHGIAIASMYVPIASMYVSSNEKS